ncbi:MAG TPA: ATP-binding protein [Candidatus Sumerlaeota bacterium]|nr:MAG: Sensor protein ZraS [candidate division BRC1 bacterium ADurb.Bin183]HOE64408.1 ATP-binding protein [Candidatus Sumerlaeota bacterium]HON49784.1 ATP-binding protein [Candidatus Sumerlaeota bacterium]HOR63968.1 ATP-binding protein [Candidatus Sumerlaeota bacterium]HRU54252.1 ATP-binding protein [Candidatus Sumerlaeia bacterium]
MALLSRSLRKRIMFVILMVSIVPAIIGTLQTYWGSLIAMDSTIGGYLQERAQQISKGIEESLRLKCDAVLKLASEPEFLSQNYELLQKSESASARRVAENYLRILLSGGSLEEDTLVLCSKNGDVMASNHNIAHASFGERLWWGEAAQVQAGQLFLAEEKPSEGGSPQILAVVPLGLPNGYDHATSSVLVAIFPAEEFLKSGALSTIGEQWTMGVYSTQGALHLATRNAAVFSPVLESHAAQMRSQYGGWFITLEAVNAKNIVAYSSISLLRMAWADRRSNFEWFIFMVFDVSDVVVVVNLLLWRMSLLGVLMVAAMLLLGLYLSNKIVVPIKTLQKGLHDIAKGNLNARVKLRTGDEIEDLADGFNSMAQELQKTYGDLKGALANVEEKANQIMLIQSITQAVNSDLNLDNIFQVLSDELKKVVDCDYAAIALLRENAAEYRLAVILPPPELSWPQIESSWEANPPMPVDGSVAELILRTGKAATVGDIASRSSRYQEEIDLLRRGIRSYLALPLISTSGILGAMILGHKQADFYTGREMSMIEQVAGALSVAVEHSRLFTRVKRFADELEEKVKERTLQLEDAHYNLVLAEKYAASGKLAASIAHEINNPLGIIKNYLRLFRDDVRRYQARLESLGLNMQPLAYINEELDRIARIVRTLQDLYRPVAPTPAPTDINYEAGKLVELMAKSLERHGISVSLDFDPNVPKTLLSPDQIRQVILNILRNAEDAISGGGEIKVRTRHLMPDAQNRRFIEVVIEDNGGGIPKEIMKNIFDPFFTTKKEGESSGLGLFVTYGIMQNIGGEIAISSEPGRGTRVRLLFPCNAV